MQKYPEFTASHLIQFDTPKGVRLQGHWLGVLRPKRVIIHTHGLTSNMFSKLAIAKLLAKDLTAVLMYNNRGHDIVARVSRMKETELSKDRLGGAAHEVFTESVDDIQGAITFALKTGAREIYLMGHSTGCQKSVYFDAKKKNPRVKGIILLAPISDRAAEIYLQGKRKLDRALVVARSMVRKNKARDLIPSTVWHEKLDAQRFISLYAPESAENTFPYDDAVEKASLLRSVKKPILAILAAKDEYDGFGAQNIADWFTQNIYAGEAVVIPEVGHGFSGAERQVAAAIARFMKESYN